VPPADPYAPPRVTPGVLVNLAAGSTRQDPAPLERLQALVPAERIQLTERESEIASALDALRGAGVDTLVLVGGDGTVGGTLTELLARWPATELPAVLLTPGGTINTIARSLGASARPDRLVQRLLERGVRAQTQRPLVQARSADGVYRSGMIFANGAAVRWLRLYYDASPGVSGAASAVARVVGSAGVGGGLAGRLFQRASVTIELDGEPIADERFTVMAASSVRHIGLGFQPFPLAGRDPERFDFAITDARAARILIELPALRLGVPLRHSCIRHRAARRVRMRFAEAQPWAIDADVFPEARELELRATQPLRFLSV